MSEATISGGISEAGGDASPPPPSRGGCGVGTVFFAVVLSAVASGALVVGSPYWTPLTQKYIELPNPLKKVEAETTRLGRGISDLDGKVNGIAADTAMLKELVGASSSAASGLRAAMLALAGSQLRMRLATGDSYEMELGAVRAAAGDDPDVKTLLESIAPNATAGIPPRSVLREAFPGTVAAVVAAEAESATEKAGSWYDSISALIGQLGYVTQINEAPQGSVHQVIRQARARLSVGDLAGAAEELGNLPQPRVAEADDWLKAAKARVVADKADSQLLTLSLARLGAAK